MEKLEIFIKDSPLNFSINNYKSLLENFDSIRIFYKTNPKITIAEAKNKIIRYVNKEYFNKLKTIPKGSYPKFIINIQEAKLDFI